jgi:hypothetical protein
MLKLWTQTSLEVNFPSYERAWQAAAQQPKWVCWTYGAEEWQRFDETMWEQSLHHVRKLALWGVALIVLVELGSIAAVTHPNPSLLEFTFPLLALAVATASVILFVRRFYLMASTAHLTRQHGPREICIGPLAVFQPGQVVPLAEYGGDEMVNGLSVLDDVRVITDAPAQICFIGRNLLGLKGVGPPITVKVPVPAGREAEAARLAQRFHAEILYDL